MNRALALRAALAALLALPLGGCAYDYMQRTDRVAYHTGNAVKANIAAQTVDPQNGRMYDTRGLGRNGPVIVPRSAADAEE